METRRIVSKYGIPRQGRVCPGSEEVCHKCPATGRGKCEREAFTIYALVAVVGPRAFTKHIKRLIVKTAKTLGLTTGELRYLIKEEATEQ